MRADADVVRVLGGVAEMSSEDGVRAGLVVQAVHVVDGQRDHGLLLGPVLGVDALGSEVGIHGGAGRATGIFRSEHRTIGAGCRR